MNVFVSLRNFCLGRLADWSAIDSFCEIITHLILRYFISNCSETVHYICKKWPDVTILLFIFSNVKYARLDSAALVIIKTNNSNNNRAF